MLFTRFVSLDSSGGGPSSLDAPRCRHDHANRRLIGRIVDIHRFEFSRIDYRDQSMIVGPPAGYDNPYESHPFTACWVDTSFAVVTLVGSRWEYLSPIEHTPWQRHT